jgi:hypothetical protein
MIGVNKFPKNEKKFMEERHDIEISPNPLNRDAHFHAI